jgi:hypothetical protein
MHAVVPTPSRGLTFALVDRGMMHDEHERVCMRVRLCVVPACWFAFERVRLQMRLISILCLHGDEVWRELGSAIVS